MIYRTVTLKALLLFLSLQTIPGCAAPEATRTTTPIGRDTTQAAPKPSRGEIVALIGGEPVVSSLLADRLHEIAGAEVLREIAVDRMLRTELDRAGIAISTADIARERTLLDETIGVGAAATTRRVLARRGLGPRGVEGLLRRTAGLRALSERSSPGSTEVTDAEIRLTRQIRFGERRVVRVIVTPDPRDAASLRRLASTGLDGFAEAAARGSTDASAARGGLIGPISLDDPAYPEALRNAVRSLAPGQISPIVGVDDTYVIARLDRVVPPEPTPDTDDAIRNELVRRKQRIAMERVAEDLLRRAQVSVLNAPLGWSWDERSAR